MKTKSIVLLTSIILNPYASAQDDPGSLSAISPNATLCGTNPADQTSYRCYNPDWATVPKIKQHLNHALVLGKHDGKRSTRGNSGQGDTEKHCTEDILFNNVEAANRALWTLKCEYVDFLKVKNKLYSLDEYDQPFIHPVVWYPLFGRDVGAGKYQVYRLGDRAMDYRTRACDLPLAEKLIHWCEAGCFAEDQLVPFVVEDIERIAAFKDLPLDQPIKVQALTRESVRESLTLEPTEARVVHHAGKDIVGSEVYEVFVESHDKPALRVTGNHPLLDADGQIVLPVELKAGQKLLTTDGAREVVQVRTVPYEGGIYNVLPTSSDLKNNILVVDGGFLVGSQRIQNRQYGYVKRIFYRESVDID